MSNEFGSCSTFEDVPSDAIDLAAVKLTVSNAVRVGLVIHRLFLSFHSTRWKVLKSKFHLKKIQVFL